MYFLLSGEGPTDMGGVNVPGPMAVMVDQIVMKKKNWSMLSCCEYVARTQLCEKLKPAKKSTRLPGKHKEKETHYFFANARTLARFAQDKKKERNDEVVAILFRDSGSSASAGRGEWDAMRQSMLDGFGEEGFSKGVPMLPKPQSEAWLICALKKGAYQKCDALENKGGNDSKRWKDDLEAILGQSATPDLLCEKVRGKAVDVDKIQMPSFKAFRDRLEAVI